jgi:hypothetical protein
MFYVSDILGAERTGDVASLFEFGHLLWRPAGLWFHFFTSRALPMLEPEAAVFTALLVPVVLGAALAAVLFFRIAWLLSGSYMVSGVTTVFFVCANGFLNYSQTGCPYVAALGFLTASVWIVLRAAARGDVRLRDVIASGACLASSVLLWLPFTTVAPGLAMLTLLYGVDWDWKGASFRRRLLRTTQLTGIVCALTGLAYGGAFRLRGYTNMVDLSRWVAASSHGWQQTLSLARLVFGFPRSYLDLGTDGVMFKRYMLHDPYAGVKLTELLAGTAVKLGLFYGVLGYLVWQLARTSSGRRLGLICAIPVTGMFLFATVLFEPGSVERYLPLHPFLVMVVASALGQARKGPQAALAVLMVLFSCSQAWARSIWSNGPRDNRTIARIAPVRPRLRGATSVWVISSADPLNAFASARPFHLYNRPTRLPVSAVVMAGLSSAEFWERDFASKSLNSWERGGEVWISNRLLAARPERSWGWTEGDVPSVQWQDLPAFFSRLEFLESLAGPDGFSLVAPSANNRRYLLAFASQPGNGLSR